MTIAALVSRVDRRQGRENQSAPDQARSTSEVKRSPRPRYSQTANGRREIAIDDGHALADAAAGKATRTNRRQAMLRPRKSNGAHVLGISHSTKGRREIKEERASRKPST